MDVIPMLRAFALPPADPNTHTVRGLDGAAEVSRCGSEADGSPEITVSLTSTGVIQDNTVVSFGPAAALALAYAIIAQVQATDARAVAIGGGRDRRGMPLREFG